MRAKRRRRGFVVGEECGNVLAPCQTSLKGVRPHSAGVGKPGRDGAHRRGAGLHCIGLSGDIWKKKKKKERRKSKEERGFWRAVSRVCLCPMTPPSDTPFPSTPPTHTQSCSESVCEFFVHHLLPLLLLLPR